jgi:hypothetical protein
LELGPSTLAKTNTIEHVWPTMDVCLVEHEHKLQAWGEKTPKTFFNNVLK